MATTTPNYGWPVPTSTDYVKDGATAIEALGDAIDATVFGLPAGLKLISSTTASGSSISVNNCFSATYVNYFIVVSQLISSATAGLTFKLRASGTDSSASYYAVAVDPVYSSGAYSSRTANNAASVVMPITQVQTTDRAGGTIFIQQPFAAQTTTFQFSGQDAVTNRGINNGSGYHNVSSSYDGFSLILSTGTFSGGTIKVYGLAN